MDYRRISTEAILKGMVRKDAAWRIVSDFSKYPSLMTNVDKVVVLDRNENEGKSEWFVTLDSAPLHWLQEDHYDALNYEIKFESIDGDFEKIAGLWKVEDLGGEGIRLNCSLDYHLGIPVIEEAVGDVLQEKMKKSIDSMALSLKNELSGLMQVEERHHPRHAIDLISSIYLNGKEMPVHVLNISKKGMMFIPSEMPNLVEGVFVIDGVVIGADLLDDTVSPNRMRAVFNREIRQDELDCVVKYLTTKNIHTYSFKPKPVEMQPA